MSSEWASVVYMKERKTTVSIVTCNSAFSMKVKGYLDLVSENRRDRTERTAALCATLKFSAVFRIFLNFRSFPLIITQYA